MTAGGGQGRCMFAGENIVELGGPSPGGWMSGVLCRRYAIDSAKTRRAHGTR